jgi:PAS domain S-box-containing protein
MNASMEIIENSPLAMAITLGPSHILHIVNPAFCALHGKDAGDILGCPFAEAILDSDESDVLNLLNGVYSGEKSGFVNHLHSSDPDGILDYKSYLAWSLSSIDVQVDGLVVQISDFTKPWPVNEWVHIAQQSHELNREMRQINERLVMSALHQQTLAEMAAGCERRLRRLIRGMNAILCEIDAVTGDFTFVSETAEAFLGYPIERWNEEGFWKTIIHPDDYEAAMAPLRATETTHKSSQYTFRVTAADGSEVWLLNVMNAVRNADGDVATRHCVIVDATEQQSAHEALIVELERNRAIAEAMQYSILWRQPKKLFHGLTVAGIYEPAVGDALVGGDFFDAFKLPDETIILAVGDVTGKGLKAASRTVEVTFALRAFAHEFIDPAETMSRLNRFICDFHYDDGRVGNALIVLSLVVINPITGATRVASAGAERPFILRADGVVEEIAVSGLILGVDRDVKYEAVDSSFHLGDTLFMTTDGITEARCGGEFFGYERLIATARQAAGIGAPHDIGKAILNTAHDFSGGRITDDICLLVVRREVV